VINLISWKHSFNRLNEEFEMAKKKKQALDNLYETGRISQTTHDAFNDDISAVIEEIEKQQYGLLERMKNTTQELDDQIKILESLLTNYEIQHAVGEIEEDTYQREIHLLGTGLETARRELEKINDAICKISTPIETPTNEVAIDTIQLETKPLEEVSPNLENPETLPESKEDIISAPDPCPPEPSLILDAPLPETSEVENLDVIPQETPQMDAPVPETSEVENLDVIPQETPQMDAPVPETSEVENLDVIPQETPQVNEETINIADEVTEKIEDNLQTEETIKFEDIPNETTQEIENETIDLETKIEVDTESDEWPQFVEEPVKFDEQPEIIEHEPLFLDSSDQQVNDAPKENTSEEDSIQQENKTTFNNTDETAEQY
jgi:hypothetical protein